MTENDGHDLKNELQRLKERARGVFGGRKVPAPEVPPVPEAPEREEGESSDKPSKPQVPVLADIPVTDEQIFIEPHPGTIETLVPGEEVETPAGVFWRVRESAGKIWERGTATH